MDVAATGVGTAGVRAVHLSVSNGANATAADCGGAVVGSMGVGEGNTPALDKEFGFESDSVSSSWLSRVESEAVGLRESEFKGGAAAVVWLVISEYSRVPV